MSTTENVAVVAPVFGNAQTLPALTSRLHDALGESLLELVLVDDASPDDSRAVIRALAEADARVRPVLLDRNVGQHAALVIGLRETRADWTVLIDADLQDPPEAIPVLVERARRGDVDAVFGGRRGRYSSPGRRLTSRAYKRLLARLVGVPSDAGTFVVLSRPLVERLVRVGGPSPAIVAMIGCLGSRVASVPVERARRAEGTSAYSPAARLRSGLRSVRWALWWRFRGAEPR